MASPSHIQPMPATEAYLLVEDLAAGTATLMTLAEAEALTLIDRHEIEWALEEYGLCESIDHVIRDTRPSEVVATTIAEPVDGPGTDCAA